MLRTTSFFRSLFLSTHLHRDPNLLTLNCCKNHFFFFLLHTSTSALKETLPAQMLKPWLFLPEQKNNFHRVLVASSQSLFWASFACAGSSLWWERPRSQPALQLIPVGGPLPCPPQVDTQENVCKWLSGSAFQEYLWKAICWNLCFWFPGKSFVFVANSDGYTLLSTSWILFFVWCCFLEEMGFEAQTPCV